MKGANLGEFEELILLIVASQGAEAYAVSVKTEVEQYRKVNISAVHSSLYRLEDKGLLKSHFGNATQKRGGKKKRLFQVTNVGFKALRDGKEQKEQLWKTIPELKTA